MNATQPEFRHVMRIWWAFTWRSVLVTLVAKGIQYLLDSLIAPALHATGLSTTTAHGFVLLLTLLAGLALSLYPIYSILGKDFGPFRLILAAKDSSKDVFHPPPGEGTRIS